MTARDLYDRAKVVEEYIEALIEAHSEQSNWNEEFGEGNPVARNLNNMRAEYETELKEIMDELDEIQVGMFK